MKAKIQRLIVGVVAVVLLTAGAVYAARGYQAENGFRPFQTKRELKNDQLLLPDEGTAAHADEETSSDNSFWEDNEAKNESQDAGKDSGYLFQQAAAQQPDNQPGNAALKEDLIRSDDNQNNPGSLPTTDVVLDIVSKNEAGSGTVDLILPGTGKTDGDSSNPDNNGNSDRNNGNGENPGTKPGGNEETPNPGTKPGGNTDNPETPAQPDTPTPIPPASRPNYADTAKDPEETKGAPSDISFGSEVLPMGPDAPEPDGLYTILFISQSFSQKLYAGQTVSEQALYCALDTYMISLDLDDPFYGSNKVYYWGADDYGSDKLFYISGVSFDGGENYETHFPVTIPNELEDGQMKIRVKYRFDMTKDWQEEIVDYIPSQTRVYVLSEQLTEENQTIDKDTIMNAGSTAPSEGEIVNLYNYQYEYFPNPLGQLPQLFPGWMEYGDIVPFLYEVTEGRHVLEPGDLIDYDTESYEVYYRSYDLLEDNSFTSDFDWLRTHCYLQTLTAYHDDTTSDQKKMIDIEVPEGVQAVDFSGSWETEETTWLNLPDSVAYVNTSGTGLAVQKGYEVSEENPNLCSEDGILYNKGKTRILGVPLDVTTLYIPEGVTDVTLPENNRIDTVVLEGGEDSYEAVNYDLLADGTRLVIDQEYLLDFVRTEQKMLSIRNFKMVVPELPQVVFQVKDGVLASDQGVLYAVLNQGNGSLYLSDEITGIEQNALANHEDISTLVLPQDGNRVEMSTEVFENSNVKKVLCYSRKQYYEAMKQVPADVDVAMLEESDNGFVYYLDENDGAVITKAPTDLTIFNGDEMGADVTISAIGDRAFAQCQELVWVTLPHTVESIGSLAFESCNALQGLLIDGEEKITIGNDAFDNCDALRFLASNAMEMELLDGYVPEVVGTYNKGAYSYLFAPTDAVGYPDNWNQFPAAYNIDSYVMLPMGDSRILVGRDEPDTEGGWSEGDWIILRAGATMPDHVELPEECYWMYYGAFGNTKSESEEGFTINWENLVPDSTGYYMILQEHAFYGSDLTGDAAFPRGVGLYDESLGACEKLKSVTITGRVEWMGRKVFAGDSALEHAVIGVFNRKSNPTVYLDDYLFDYCNSLQTIELLDCEPYDLAIMGIQDRYRFNSAWTIEEEAEKLHLIVPEGCEENYLNAWTYTFAGYTPQIDSNTIVKTAYQNMRDYIIRRSLVPLTTEEVDEKIAAALLEAENRLRMMLGMETVEIPTDLYNYVVDSDGMITLTSVYTNEESITLDANTIGLPTGWYLDYIGTAAFKHAKNLRTVTADATLAGITSGAFAGAPNEITLVLQSVTPPALLLADGEFDFSGLAAIQVPEGYKDSYFESWKYQLIGYSDYYSLYNELYMKILDDLMSQDPDFDIWNADFDAINQQIEEQIAQMLAPYEETIQKMHELLGIEETETPDLIEEPESEQIEESELPEVEVPEAEMQPEEDLPELPQVETPAGSVEESDPNGETESEKEPDESEESEAEKSSEESEQEDASDSPEEGEVTEEEEE